MDSLSGVLEWSAHEHEHTPRERQWYIALAVIAVAVALASVLLHDTLFGILFILAAVSIGLLAEVHPELTTFTVSDRGIRVADTMHRYEEIISFWVEVEKGDMPHLLVDTTKISAPNLIIPIVDVNPDDVRNYLLQYSKEVPMTEPVYHKILEFFGF